ncbi:MAG: hypothetical protein P8079_06995 [Gammaproteobacteria bacterium]|jgi:hypothetical protein
MKSTLRAPALALVVFGLMFAGTSNAAGEFKYRSGVYECGFSHFSRLGGTEDHTSSINLRNQNDDVTIKVNRMRMFRADGSLISEVPESMLPTLGPRQSLTMNSRDYWALMSLPQEPREQRPFQLFIEWSVLGHQRGYRLGANVVRLVRDGGNGAERSRHRGSCRHLQLRF